MSKLEASLQELVNLPSRGIPYKGQIQSSFMMRPLTVNETKMFYGTGNVQGALDKVLGKVIDIEDFPVGELVMGDKLYLAYQLRALTFGENYDLPIHCQSCDKQSDVSFNLNEAEIDYADENYSMTTDIGKLPVCGDTVITKILRVKDYEKLFKRVKEITDQYPEYEGSPFVPLLIAAQISTINGEKKHSRELEEYANNMHAKDELYFTQKTNRASVGPKSVQHVECPNCGSKVPIQIVVGEDFFRPELKF